MVIFFLILGTIFWLIFLVKKYQIEEKINETKVEERPPKKIKIEQIKEKTPPQKKVSIFEKSQPEISKKEEKAKEIFLGEKEKVLLQLLELEKEKLEIQQIFERIKKISLEFLEELENQKKEIITDLKGKLEGELENYQKEIGKIVTMFEENVKVLNEKILKEFSQKLEKNVGEILASFHRELENYKKEKFKEIDEKVFEILESTLEKVGAKVIDFSVHQKLIFEALEKAKKEKFFEETI